MAREWSPASVWTTPSARYFFLLYGDPFPWTVEELGRELGDLGDASDAVTSLAAAGLLHRFSAVACRNGSGPEFVIPTRAARRSDELHEHSL